MKKDRAIGRSRTASCAALPKPLSTAMLLLAVIMMAFSSASPKCEAAEPATDSAAGSYPETSRKITVTLTKRAGGVTYMQSRVYIQAPPGDVWKVLTDYDNLKRYIPRMTKSSLVEDNGTRKVVALTGEIGLLLFKKTIQMTMNMVAIYPHRVDFEKISGDFDIYSGHWILEEHPSGKGTWLDYVAEIKPSFLAPGFIFDSMLKKDITEGLGVIRSEAEQITPK
ncbi:MAG TPA: SRPBCC family protein [Chlorobaculum sp.]|nr:SRPBCC family protein [Chlorobaculum sp.]